MSTHNGKPGKAEGKADCAGTVPPIVEFVISKYGSESCDQFTVWKQELGFPAHGSFSMRQIKALKEKMERKEKEDKERALMSTKENILPISRTLESFYVLE